MGHLDALQARSPSQGQPALQAPRLGLYCHQFLRYVSTLRDELPPDGVPHGSRGLTEAEPSSLELLGWVAGDGGLRVAPRPGAAPAFPRWPPHVAVGFPQNTWSEGPPESKQEVHAIREAGRQPGPHSRGRKADLSFRGAWGIDIFHPPRSWASHEPHSRTEALCQASLGTGSQQVTWARSGLQALPDPALAAR